MKAPFQAYQEKMDQDDAAKLSKEVVLYINCADTQYTCDSCVFYKQKKCALYGPTVPIEPYGGCNLWVHMDADDHESEIPWLGLLSKLQTGYMENKQGFSCKRCEEFIPGQNSCEQVNRHSPGDDPGMIAPNACCNRFELDKQRGKMTTDQLMKLFA